MLCICTVQYHQGQPRDVRPNVSYPHTIISLVLVSLLIWDTTSAIAAAIRLPLCRSQTWYSNGVRQNQQRARSFCHT